MYFACIIRQSRKPLTETKLEVDRKTDFRNTAVWNFSGCEVGRSVVGSQYVRTLMSYRFSSPPKHTGSRTFPPLNILACSLIVIGISFICICFMYCLFFFSFFNRAHIRGLPFVSFIRPHALRYWFYVYNFVWYELNVWKWYIFPPDVSPCFSSA